MIFDHLDNAALYDGLGKRISIALNALRSGQWQITPPGRYEIAGSDVFALVQDYHTKPLEQGKWEAHRRHIDVQYVAGGVERIGIARISDMKIVQAYDAEKDVMFLEGRGDFVTLNQGDFAILYPHDAHMPQIDAGSPGPVRKIVIKVRQEGA